MKPARSKHCKICDKCVYKFDHHCNWINNCIGEKNYNYFFILLISSFSNLILKVSFFILSIKNYFILGKNLNSNLKILITYFIFGLVDLIVSCNIIYLIVMHIYLRRKGLTTYEYIIKCIDEKRIIEIEKEKEKEKEKKNDHSEEVPIKKIEKILSIGEPKKKKNNFIEVKSKGRNKIEPENLLEKIKQIEKSKGLNPLKINNEFGKILIDEKDYKDLIFKPIVEEIYFKNNDMNRKRTKKCGKFNAEIQNVNMKIDKFNKSNSITCRYLGNNSSNLNIIKNSNDGIESKYDKIYTNV